MHELPLVKSIFESAVSFASENKARKVTEVHLQIGVLRDIIPEYVYKYWIYVSKDTIAEDSHLFIEEIPASAKCSRCGRVYVVDHEHIQEQVCPGCGYGKGQLLTGREIILDRISIQ